MDELRYQRQMDMQRRLRTNEAARNRADQRWRNAQGAIARTAGTSRDPAANAHRARMAREAIAEENIALNWRQGRSSGTVDNWRTVQLRAGGPNDPVRRRRQVPEGWMNR